VEAPVENDTRPVRAGEELDGTRLVAWLRERLPQCVIPPESRAPGTGIDTASLSIPPVLTQFPGGHSNLTYLLQFGDMGVVVRRPPIGPVAPTAHDMAREFRWLSAMHRVFPLAPRPYLLCEDTSVIGAVFYAMERRRGIVVRAEEPPELADNPAARRAVSEAVIDTLAELHAVDVSGHGLSALGKPSGFVARQVRGWSERWARSQTTPLPEMDQLAAWLRTNLPSDPVVPSVVHGDFKLDNVMLDPANVGRIVAVFDWEMSALGDPLVDLGILLAYWSPTSPPQQQDALTTVTHRPGYLTRVEIIDRYARRSGRDVSAIRYFEIFALFKVAVVIQQIYYRWTIGQTTDARFSNFDTRVANLATRATRLAAL
jgi:aminoglycoside phosphotransferase (APT) family kinase protein